MAKQPGEFWTFSLALYSRQGVEDICLGLQNRHALDVNLLFWCCWYGLRYGELPAPTLASALAFSTTWKRSVVQPLRDVRTRLKEADGFAASSGLQRTALRERIKADELAAERYQQQVLETMVPDDAKAGNGCIAAARHNVERLLVELAIDNGATDPALRAALATITNEAASC